MAPENPSWGQERIANELLLKLGLRVSPRTVRKYMPRPAPVRPRGDQRWSTFLRNHARAIIACDFCVAVTSTFRVLFITDQYPSDTQSPHTLTDEQVALLVAVVSEESGCVAARLRLPRGPTFEAAIQKTILDYPACRDPLRIASHEHTGEVSAVVDPFFARRVVQRTHRYIEIRLVEVGERIALPRIELGRR